MDDKTLRVYVQRDDEGWYAVSGWDGTPFVFRLPEGYDPHDDNAELVVTMLCEYVDALEDDDD